MSCGVKLKGFFTSGCVIAAPLGRCSSPLTEFTSSATCLKSGCSVVYGPCLETHNDDNAAIQNNSRLTVAQEFVFFWIISITVKKELRWPGIEPGSTAMLTTIPPTQRNVYIWEQIWRGMTRNDDVIVTLFFFFSLFPCVAEPVWQRLVLEYSTEKKIAMHKTDHSYTLKQNIGSPLPGALLRLSLAVTSFTDLVFSDREKLTSDCCGREVFFFLEFFQ